MSGHSKWHNIQGRKNAQDAKRGKIFQKLSREIYMAAKSGGPDPDGNPTLRMVIDKARSNNMPNDNINRTIKKAAGDTDSDNYESITYEGYGPAGVAVIVNTLTDNRNRTAADVRHAFDKNGGNMGQTGCVSFMFSLKGIVVLDNEDGDIDEDKAMEDILEAGGDDFSFEEGCVEISTDPNSVSEVAENLAKMGYKVLSAEAEQVPSTYVTLTDEEHLKKMNLLLEALDDNDDVQNVWHNWEEE